MLRSMDDSSAEVLRQQLQKETDSEVKDAISIGLALVDLDNSDAAVRLKAIDTLHGSLNPDVFNRLTQLVTPNEDGSYSEPALEVRMAARELLDSMETARGMARARPCSSASVWARCWCCRPSAWPSPSA
jgi:urea transport system permease protein